MRILTPCASLLLLTACGGGGGGGGNPLLVAQHPPVVALPQAQPPDKPLMQYKLYTLTTTAQPVDLGTSVASCTWTFDDGSPDQVVTTPPFSVQHAFLLRSDGLVVTVTPKDSRGLTGATAQAPFGVATAPNPVTTAVVAPTTITTLKAPAGGTVAATFSFTVAEGGSGTVTAQSIAFQSGTPGTTPPVVTTGPADGKTAWSLTLTYPAGAGAGGTYTAYPSLIVTDSLGIPTATLGFPAVNIETIN